MGSPRFAGGMLLRRARRVDLEGADRALAARLDGLLQLLGADAVLGHALELELELGHRVAGVLRHDRRAGAEGELRPLLRDAAARAVGVALGLAQVGVEAAGE